MKKGDIQIYLSFIINEKHGYRLILGPERGKTSWVPDESNAYNHSFLQLRDPKIRLKETLEDLLIKPPKTKI